MADTSKRTKKPAAAFPESRVLSSTRSPLTRPAQAPALAPAEATSESARPAVVGAPAASSPATPLRSASTAVAVSESSSINTDIKDIPISSILIPDDAELLRKDVEGPEFEELKASIKRHGGVLQNIVVRKEPGALTGPYVLVAGLRRLTAVTQLGFPTIASYYLGVMTAREASFAMYEENDARKENAPVDIALWIVHMIDVHRVSLDELQERIGLKRSSAARYRRIGDFLAGVTSEERAVLRHKAVSWAKLEQAAKETEPGRAFIDRMLGVVRTAIAVENGEVLEMPAAEQTGAAAAASGDVAGGSETQVGENDDNPADGPAGRSDGSEGETDTGPFKARRKINKRRTRIAMKLSWRLEDVRKDPAAFKAWFDREVLGPLTVLAEDHLKAAAKAPRRVARPRIALTTAGAAEALGQVSAETRHMASRFQMSGEVARQQKGGVTHPLEPRAAPAFTPVDPGEISPDEVGN